MEPLAVAVNANTSIAEVKVSDNVVVFGAGPVGIL
jgi:threonine dehydrogenase-like Zn-dependent dehydrogenase